MCRNPEERLPPDNMGFRYGETIQTIFTILNLTAMVDPEKNPLVHECLKLFSLDDRHLETRELNLEQK